MKRCLASYLDDGQSEAWTALCPHREVPDSVIDLEDAMDPRFWQELQQELRDDAILARASMAGLRMRGAVAAFTLLSRPSPNGGAR